MSSIFSRLQQREVNKNDIVGVEFPTAMVLNPNPRIGSSLFGLCIKEEYAERAEFKISSGWEKHENYCFGGNEANASNIYVSTNPRLLVIQKSRLLMQGQEGAPEPYNKAQVEEIVGKGGKKPRPLTYWIIVVLDENNSPVSTPIRLSVRGAAGVTLGKTHTSWAQETLKEYQRVTRDLKKQDTLFYASFAFCPEFRLGTAGYGNNTSQIASCESYSSMSIEESYFDDIDKLVSWQESTAEWIEVNKVKEEYQPAEQQTHSITPPAVPPVSPSASSFELTPLQQWLKSWVEAANQLEWLQATYNLPELSDGEIWKIEKQLDSIDGWNTFKPKKPAAQRISTPPAPPAPPAPPVISPLTDDIPF